MGVNFKSTFEQPLNQAFDSGLCFGGSDIAKYITKYYVDTIKTGIGPIATPPASYITADGRSKLMENVISLYYQSKEIDILQDNIKDTTANISNLINKGKKIQADISTTAQQIAINTKQAIQLPIEIATIAVSLIRLLKDQVFTIQSIVYTQLGGLISTSKTSSLASDIAKYQLKLNIIKELPATLHSIISDITPFNVTDKISQITNIPTILSGLLSDAKKDLSAAGIIITDMVKRLLLAFDSITNLMLVIITPEKSLDLLEGLIQQNPKIRVVYDKFKLIFIKQKNVNKSLKKLELQRNKLVERLTSEVTNRIEKYKKIVEDKIKQLTAKVETLVSTESKIKFIAETIKSTQQDLSLLNKKIGPLVQKISKNIIRAQKILQATQALIKLLEDIKNVFVEFIGELQVEASRAELLFNELGSKNIEAYKTFISSTKYQSDRFQTTLQDVVSLNAQSSNPEELANKLAQAAISIQKSVADVSATFSEKGLSQYATFIMAPILAGTATAVEFKQFLNFNSKKYNAIYNRAQITVGGVLDIYDEIRAEAKGVPYVKISRPLIDIRDAAMSTEDLFKGLKQLFNKVDKIYRLVGDKINEFGILINKYIQLGLQKTEAYFVKLLKPVNSFVDDVKSKVDDKFNQIQNQLLEKKQLINYALAATYSGLAVKSFVQFTTNIATGNYSISSNDKLINDGFNDYVKVNSYIKKASSMEKMTPELIKNEFQGIQMMAVTGTATAQTLSAAEQAQKQKLLKVSLYLRELEDIFNLIKNMKSDMQASGSQITDQLKRSFTDSRAINNVRETLVNFVDIFKSSNDPTKLISFIKSINMTNYQPTELVSYLVSLETTFFGKTRDAINKSELKTKIPDSIILYVMQKIQTLTARILQIIETFIQVKLKDIEIKIAAKLEKIKKQTTDLLNVSIKKNTDVDGKIFTIALYSSLIAYWVGATWNNTNGDVVIVLSPGSPPAPINAPASEGLTKYIAEITRVLDLHLKTIAGTYIKQTPTGPIVIPWVGYN